MDFAYIDRMMELMGTETAHCRMLWLIATELGQLTTAVRQLGALQRAQYPDPDNELETTEAR